MPLGQLLAQQPLVLAGQGRSVLHPRLDSEAVHPIQVQQRCRCGSIVNRVARSTRSIAARLHQPCNVAGCWVASRRRPHPVHEEEE